MNKRAFETKGRLCVSHACVSLLVFNLKSRIYVAKKTTNSVMFKTM